MSPNTNTAMPDIAVSKGEVSGTINWVGMSKLALAIQVPLQNGAQTVKADADIHVNLIQSDVRGVHMSRMFLLLDKFSQEQMLTPDAVKTLLGEVLQSQDNLSDGACITFRFDLLLRRDALLSENSGWREYPAGLTASLNSAGEYEMELLIKVAYSSTCPCSQALARKHISDSFADEFAQEQPSTSDVVKWLEDSDRWAAAHSQRSEADIRIKLAKDAPTIYAFESLVEGIESTFRTPVQAAVKREDEQEFARLNGENPMFVEDASRRLRQYLCQRDDVTGFRANIHHYESLHAHDATAGIEHNYGEVIGP